MVTGTVIHWFRKGLRLHDNPALLAAVDRAAKDGLLLRPVFILDPWFVKKARVGPNRYGILLSPRKKKLMLHIIGGDFFSRALWT